MLQPESHSAPSRRRYSPPASDHVLPWPGGELQGSFAFEERRIFAAGDLSLLADVPRLSIIGSRDASEHGCRRAARLARSVTSAGIVVVAGLARGIDRAAHEAAIASGGRTIAVIGTPLDRCYPPEHAALQELIHHEHLLVSMFGKGAPVKAANFPQRNRLMAALSDASVIVEAGETSGSLSQAAETQRLGKPLFLMRSLVENKSLTWPHAFISKGAIVLDDAQQVLEALKHVGSATT